MRALLAIAWLLSCGRQTGQVKVLLGVLYQCKNGPSGLLLLCHCDWQYEEVT